MDNFDRIEQHIFSREVFGEDGEWKEDYGGYWKARLADHRLAEEMRQHCAPALLARSRSEIDAAFAAISEFAGELRLEKAASDWAKSVPVTIPVETLKAAYMGDWTAMVQADAYALGHDAYGHAHAGERTKPDNLTDAFATMSVAIGERSGDGPDGPNDE